MPTLPAEPPAPHEQRRMAESFGVDPARYDRNRPGNPPEVSAGCAELFPRMIPDSPIRMGAGRDPVALYQTLVARTAGHIRGVGGFGEPEQLRFDWARSYDRAGLFELMATQGGLTQA